MSRRRLFGWFAKAAGAAAAGLLVLPVLEACTTEASDAAGPDAAAGTDARTTAIDATTGAGTCAEIPEETAGPYPADGTNGVNALARSGIERRDITPSLAGTAVAAGVPLTITLTILDVTTCTPLVGYAVYLWHCDRDGNYSMYSSAAKSETYLRGVQVTDANGQVTFTSIFPACYAGRWPHIHYEVYSSLAQATTGTDAVAVSQLALPKAACDTVYGTTGYSQSVSNLGQITLATDNVFSDGATLEIPTVTGSVAAGYVATLSPAISA